MKRISLAELTIALLAVALIGFAFAVARCQIPPRLENTFIQDHARVLTVEQTAALEAKVRVLQKERSIEFGLVTVPTTGGQDIHDYTLEVARKYDIGNSTGERRGLIVLLAINDRHWWIMPSFHVQGWITDGQCGDVGRNYMVPFLKRKDYYGALNEAVDRLKPLALGMDKEPVPATAQVNPVAKREGASAWWLLLPVGLAAVGLIGVSLYVHKRRREEEEAEAEYKKRRREYDDYQVQKAVATGHYSTTKAHGEDYYPKREPTVEHKQAREDYTPMPSYHSDPSPSPSSDSSSSSFGGGDSGGSDFGGGGAGGSW